MPQVGGLACAPAVVVDDVGAGVDGLTVGGDEVGRWPGVVGGKRRVRGSVLELQWFGWRAVEGVCRQWATTWRVHPTLRVGACVLLLDRLCEQGPDVLDL